MGGTLSGPNTSCCSLCLQESLLEENAEKAFYGSDEEDAKDDKTETASLVKRKPYVMDPDHRLLLRNTKPLLQSRNAAVSTPLPAHHSLPWALHAGPACGTLNCS